MLVHAMLFLLCRYILWKLCASVIVLNIVLGIVIKSYFSAIGFSVGASASAGDTVANLIASADQNNVSDGVKPPQLYRRQRRLVVDEQRIASFLFMHMFTLRDSNDHLSVFRTLTSLFSGWSS